MTRNVDATVPRSFGPEPTATWTRGLWTVGVGTIVKSYRKEPFGAWLRLSFCRAPAGTQLPDASAEDQEPAAEAAAVYSASHNRAVLSSEAVSTRQPPGLKTDCIGCDQAAGPPSRVADQI
jgi:hypothetical protein